jgi:hypothetical protein
MEIHIGSRDHVEGHKWSGSVGGSRDHAEGHKSPGVRGRLKRSRQRSLVIEAPRDETVPLVDTCRALIGQARKYM